MFHRTIIAATLAFTIAMPATAQTRGDADALFDAIGMPQVITIMRDEGIAGGGDIAQDMFPAAPRAEWNAALDDIYDADRMTATARAKFADALDGVDTAPMLDFFTSDLGQRIVTLEVDARRAILDDDVERRAKDEAHEQFTDDTPRARQITEFIESGDLIEVNVMGALNSSLAFYRGLMAGGAFGAELTEDQALADVWQQEPSMRASSTEWLYGYLMLAYSPLSDDDLQTYIDFSDSDAGGDLNTALFAAFDDVFIQISRALGVAAAGQMQGDTL